MKIGSKIRELRREKMWTQKDLGNAIGMSSHTIALWEGCKIMPSENARKELAKVFGVPIEYLMKDGEEKPSDGSDEAKALLKVAENEIKQLKDEKEKLINEIAWYKDEIERLKADKEELHKRLQEERRKKELDEDIDRLMMTINEVKEENYKLKETVVHLAMKGALN